MTPLAFLWSPHYPRIARAPPLNKQRGLLMQTGQATRHAAVLQIAGEPLAAAGS